MALKKLTFKEQRKRIIESSLAILKNFRFPKSAFFMTINSFIEQNYKIAIFWSTSFEECTKQFYGSPDDENDIEWLLAQILFSYSIIKKLNYDYVGSMYDKGGYTRQNQFYKNSVLDNAKKNISYAFPEYEIFWDTTKDFVEFMPKETKTVVDNIKDMPAEIANPISELLQPMKNENELIGLISKVYMKFEKIGKNSLTNLNEIDKSIFSKARELAKMVANNVSGAKGHEGKSELTVKDIAHNFALNASLVQRLINLNEDLKNND